LSIINDLRKQSYPQACAIVPRGTLETALESALVAALVAFLAAALVVVMLECFTWNNFETA